MEDPKNHEFKTVYCARCGHSHTFVVRCKDRFCKVCQFPRVKALRDRLMFIVQRTSVPKNHAWKHLVLTWPSHESISDGIDHAIESFRRLRQRKEWKAHVAGGAYTIEVTKNDGLYHVHIHVIACASYWAVHRISRLWESCSGGKIVFIRKCTGREGVNYLVKYALSPDGVSVQDDIVNVALHQRRLFCVFGLLQVAAGKWTKPPFLCPICHYCDWVSILPLDRSD